MRRILVPLYKMPLLSCMYNPYCNLWEQFWAIPKPLKSEEYFLQNQEYHPRSVLVSPNENQVEPESWKASYLFGPSHQYECWWWLLLNYCCAAFSPKENQEPSVRIPAAKKLTFFSKKGSFSAMVTDGNSKHSNFSPSQRSFILCNKIKV